MAVGMETSPTTGHKQTTTMNQSPTTNDQSPHLVRHFGTLQATALNMSNMIGIGPFLTIPLLMSALGGPQAMLGWLVAVLIVIPDGMVWSELGASMPGSGGSYLYLREGFGSKTFGRLMTFLFITQYLICSVNFFKFIFCPCIFIDIRMVFTR